ncbi:MAG: energy-coupling factor transporter ATPase [Clostridia bacterium]|nr:energy-coupling factor transporter ATPase [Clostridia bacterium]MCL6521230.1 energy-coupling factor transporter ATPase [Bacillota bacterium]
MAHLIEVRGVRYFYPSPDEGEQRRTALDGVDLTVDEGEWVAVVGANGSGKSTLAKHLNALLLPAEGEVLVDGRSTRDPGQLWTIRRTVGMVFQNPDNQIVASLVEEDVAFGPENLGLPPAEIRSRIASSLAAVGMSQFARRAPYQLSGGQKQRVAIAGVLAMEPRCLVLDEATAMLDPAGRAEVLEAVERLRRERGIAVVMITHFMDEVARAERLVVMDGGRVVADASPRALLGRVEEVAQLGLEVPQASELALELRRRGLPLPADLIAPGELVEALCRLKSST